MYPCTDEEMREMLDQIYCSPPVSDHLPFFTADPPALWRAEVEALAETRDVAPSAFSEAGEEVGGAADHWGSDRAGMLT